LKLQRDATAGLGRAPSLGEEIANSLSHGLGLVASLVAAPALLLPAMRGSDRLSAVATSVFWGSMVLLYLASTIYHALPPTRAKRLFRVVDHGAIFVFIAGTYTPFTLGVLRGPWGWALFGIVWTLALAGLTLKVLGRIWHPALSTSLYLAMGWLAVLAIRPLWQSLPSGGLLLLAAGGLAYTVGVAFFVAERLRYSHFVWHLFVLAGTACHFCAVLWYAA
jgi:hemolysin III